jgi:hypothetical protein
VADQMTVDLLCERDTEGEIASWLKAIGGLAESR